MKFLNRLFGKKQQYVVYEEEQVEIPVQFVDEVKVENEQLSLWDYVPEEEDQVEEQGVKVEEQVEEQGVKVEEAEMPLDELEESLEMETVLEEEVEEARARAEAAKLYTDALIDSTARVDKLVEVLDAVQKDLASKELLMDVAKAKSREKLAALRARLNK